MSYGEYLSSCTESSNSFFYNIKIEIELLNLKLNEIKKLAENAKKLEKSLENISTILDNKELFISIAPELNDVFELLEFLKEKNNMDNAAVFDSYNMIVNNSKVNVALKEVNELNNEIENIIQRINELNKLLKGDYDFESINKILDDLKYDEEDKEKIMFNLLIQKKLKKEISIEKTNENKEISIPVNEPKELPNKDIPNEIFSEDKKDETNDRNEEDEKINYDEVLSKYNEINQKYDYLFKEYYTKMLKLENEKMYDIYSKNSLEYILTNLGLSDEELAIVLYKKLQNEKQMIDKAISDINGKLVNDDEYELTAYVIKDYLDMFDKFLKLSSKTDLKKENLENDSSTTFFIHDGSGNILLPNMSDYTKKVEAFIGKSDIGALNNMTLQTYRMLGVENEEKYLGKRIFMLNDSIVISYVKLNNGGTYVIAIEPSDQIAKITKEVISEHGEDIKKQIELLEKNNQEELYRQYSIRKEIRNKKKSNEVGGR